MKIILSYLLVASAIIGPFLGHAQNVDDRIKRLIPNPLPPSPNVASLGKFGDYPVGHYTGIPDISIPIFEVTSGDLKVPITLMYHASGVKPTDVASWVGTGWSVTAGGQISVRVNGRPDEDYYLTHPLNPNPSVCNTYYYLKGAANQWLKDTEPDIFSYSYPGRSGKFMFPNEGVYVNENVVAPIGPAYLFPYAPIKVNRVNSNKYEITEENGTVYRFGTSSLNEYATESTNTYTGGQLNHAQTALHLMEMGAPNSDDAIVFKYQNVGIATSVDYSYTFKVQDDCGYEPPFFCPGTYSGVPDKVKIEVDVNQEGLREILFENGKVEFILGPAGSNQKRSDANQLKYLDRIKIYSIKNGAPTLEKTVRFIYSYFTNSIGGNAALKLDEIQFQGTNPEITIQRYKFSYFTNSFSWNPNHVNFWNARDLWGYYNGALQNTDLLLQKTISFRATVNSPVGNITFGGAFDRKVNPLYVKEGVLSRIDFPTGGYTQFDYESNRYFNDEESAAPESTLAGGLRVTKIISNDGSGSPSIVKTYRYGLADSGYGKHNFKPSQFNYSNMFNFRFVGCGVGMGSLNYTIRTFHSNSAFTFESNPICYPYVSEYNGDINTAATHGKTVYQFDNGSFSGDMHIVVPASSKYFLHSNAWKRGKLTNKTVYDNANRKLSENATQYGMFHETLGKFVGLGVYEFSGNGDVICTSQNACYIDGSNKERAYNDTFMFSSYFQNSGALLPTIITQKIYQADDALRAVTSSTTNTYDANKLQLKQSVSTHSNSIDQSVTINTYPFELIAANASSTGAAKGIYMLNSKNIVSSPVETYTYLQKPDNTNRRIVSGQVTTFRQNSANAAHVVADQIYIWESATNESSYLPITINATNSGVTFNANQKPRIALTEYDAKGNIQTVSKTNDLVVSYKWGYANTLPIAEITNALSKNVFYTSFEEETTNVWMGGKTGRYSSVSAAYSKALTGLDQGTYILAYYKLGTKWDYNETTVSVPAAGDYTINLPLGQYDEIRFYPKNARLTTYTYDPLVGVTSITDTNGITKSYIYDSFGRLEIIRDNNNNILKGYEYNYKITN